MGVGWAKLWDPCLSLVVEHTCLVYWPTGVEYGNGPPRERVAPIPNLCSLAPTCRGGFSAGAHPEASRTHVELDTRLLCWGDTRKFAVIELILPTCT